MSANPSANPPKRSLESMISRENVEIAEASPARSFRNGQGGAGINVCFT